MTLPLAILAALALAGPASAADLRHNGPVIDFTVAATDRIDLKATGQELGIVGMTFQQAPDATPLTTSSGCSINTRTGIAKCGVGTGNSLHLTTADENDKIDASRTDQPFDVSVPEVFDTKGGDDELTAGPLADTVDAGAGNDTITGGPGADQLHGDEGDDTFLGLTSGDLVDGGAGIDVLDLSAVASGGASISLDGLANDGPLGSNANVTAVEEVRGTPSADVLTGGAAAETLKGADGDDTIDARGGDADVVDCGGGNDFARVDEIDQVIGCESVERPATQGLPGLVAPPLVDADADGVVAGADCDDARADVRPGARDRPGDGVDEDCSGADAKFTASPARLSFLWLGRSDGTTRAGTLSVRDIPNGGKVEVRCTGPGCKARSRTAKVARGKANLVKLVSKRLRAGAKVEIRITAPDFFGKSTSFTMRSKGRQPAKKTKQLAPPR